jgi:hypothetical protein
MAGRPSCNAIADQVEAKLSAAEKAPIKTPPTEKVVVMIVICGSRHGCSGSRTTLTYQRISGRQFEALSQCGPIFYGQLKLHPWWDRLRGDSRFDGIMEKANKPVALT